MSKTLTVTNKPGQLYAKMSAAIANCYSVDDCKHVADHAAAVAAYFKQIKDDESVRKFLAVKLRAWRRMGEIFAKIDSSGCATQTAYLEKIKDKFFGDTAPPGLSAWSIRNAIQVAKLPKEFFDEEVNYHKSVESMLRTYQDLLHQQWLATPEGQEAAKAEEKRRKESEAESKKDSIEYVRARTQERKDLDMLREARAEVGFTMDRRDREIMKEVMLLINTKLHAVLRQAAFDHRMTMQAVLRAGLILWLNAKGYDTDMTAEFRKVRKDKNIDLLP